MPRISLILICSAWAVMGFANVLSAATPAEEAVRAADLAWEKTFAAGDIDAAVAGCLENASMMAPNAPIATGKQAIRGLLSIVLGAPSLKISWVPVRVEVARSGDFAYTSGTYEVSFDEPGKRAEDKGKYLTIWKKEGSVWKVAQDIFNSDLPAPGGPANQDMPVASDK